MAIRYEIDWPKLHLFTKGAAYKVMRTTIAEVRIVARRNVLWGPYTRTHRLAQSIYGTLRTTPTGFQGRVGSRLSYAASVEEGASPHTIRPRNPGGWLHFYWERQGRWVRTKSVNHPGQKGKWYLRNALLRVAKRRGFRVTIY